LLNRTWKVVKLPPAVALGHHLGANVGSGLGHGLLPVDVGRVEGGRGEVSLRCHQVEAARGSDDRSRRDLSAGDVLQQGGGLDGGRAGHHVAAHHDVRRCHGLAALQAGDEVRERGVLRLHHLVGQALCWLNGKSILQKPGRQGHRPRRLPSFPAVLSVFHDDRHPLKHLGAVVELALPGLPIVPILVLRSSSGLVILLSLVVLLRACCS
jgi:hypothetical protein